MTTYQLIHSMLLKNDTLEVLVDHMYIEDCDRFSYFLLLLTPFIIVAIVFRVTYGWKAQKTVKRYRPGKFFKESEIRIYAKRNIKFVKMIIEGVLSVIIC